MKILILGLGYCGESWYLELKNNPEFEVFGQSRNSKVADYKLDLESLSIAEFEALLGGVDFWLLTTDLSKYSQALFDGLLRVLAQKPGVVIGSSGDFEESEDSLLKDVGEVNSSFALNKTSRNERQTKLMKEGAFVLHLAGIWGENRDPMIWLQKNLISIERVGVNLIHRSDILKVLVFVFKNFEQFKASRDILVDKHFYLWSDIVEKAMKLEKVPTDYERPFKTHKRRNKIVKASRDWEALVGFKFKNYLA